MRGNEGPHAHARVQVHIPLSHAPIPPTYLNLWRSADRKRCYALPIRRGTKHFETLITVTAILRATYQATTNET